MAEHLMCELSVPGRVGFRFPEPDVPSTPLPENFTREDLPLPELSEVDVVLIAAESRHRHRFLSIGLVHHEIQPEDQ